MMMSEVQNALAKKTHSNANIKQKNTSSAEAAALQEAQNLCGLMSHPAHVAQTVTYH